MTLTYLERLPAIEEEIAERWLVREGNSPPHVVAVVANADTEWVSLVERATTPWIGFRHRAISSLRGVTRIDGQLVCEHDDDRGPSLLPAARQLPPEERVPWAIANLTEVADALCAMGRYQPGFVHRRLGPPWLVVAADGRLRLRAPIAHVSVGPRRPYMGAGTLSPGIDWLSPEQIRGVPVPPASDVYQLAATLYAAIGARNPHPGASAGDRFSRILSGEPAAPLPEAPPEIAAVIARGLALSLDERYPDLPAFAAALRAAAPAADDRAARERLAAWWASAPAAEAAPLFGGRCTLRWSQLSPTFRDDIRHCDTCQQPVIEVRALAGIVPLSGKQCFRIAGG